MAAAARLGEPLATMTAAALSSTSVLTAVGFLPSLRSDNLCHVLGTIPHARGRVPPLLHAEGASCASRIVSGVKAPNSVRWAVIDVRVVAAFRGDLYLQDLVRRAWRADEVGTPEWRRANVAGVD